MHYKKWMITGGFLTALLALGAWFFVASNASKQTPVNSASLKLSCELPFDNAASPRPGMVWIPEGKFDMGDTVYAEEKPVRNIKVKGFWMDRTEVTNDEFAAFVKATGYVTIAERNLDPLKHAQLPADMLKAGAVVFSMPAALKSGDDPSQWWKYVVGANWRHPAGPNTSIEKYGSFPAVHVTYEDAKAYAQWKGHQLPTEAQWEWAARAGAPEMPSQHDQPAGANTWQGIFPMANSSEDGFAGLAPVGCYAPNAYGLFDMIGNVWELTADVFVANRLENSQLRTKDQGLDPDDAQRPPTFKQATGGARVIKGGSFLCAPNYCMRYRAGSRQPQEEDLAVSHLGFRTIYQPASIN
jgi:formylglycine-generating enzyme required for sulfatase activity